MLLVRSSPACEESGPGGQSVNGALGVIVFVNAEGVQQLAPILRLRWKISTEDASNVLLDLNPKAVRSDLGETKKHLLIENSTVILKEVTNAPGLRFCQERIDADECLLESVQSVHVAKQIVDLPLSKDGSVECGKEWSIPNNRERRKLRRYMKKVGDEA